MKKAFFDTNILIAFAFQINSLHLKSNNVFEIYSQYYWSNFVKSEFDRRYWEKLINIMEFFKDLQIFFQNPEKDLFSIKDLISFVRSNYSGKLMKDAESSINPFWSKYIGFESQVTFFNMNNAINFCLNDLILKTDYNKQDLEKIMQLTPQRTKKYSNINGLLKLEGVSLEDRKVILDGNDFACRFHPIDFVTFDEGCYQGALNVEVLCFSSIKGKNDFRNAS